MSMLVTSINFLVESDDELTDEEVSLFLQLNAISVIAPMQQSCFIFLIM